MSGFKFMSPRTKGAFGIQPKITEDDAGNLYADDEIIGNTFDEYAPGVGQDNRTKVDDRSWGAWLGDTASAIGQGAKSLVTMPYEAGKELHKSRMTGAFEGAPEPDQSSPATWLANTAAMPEALVRGAGSALAGAATTWSDPNSTDKEKAQATFDTVSLTPAGGLIAGGLERNAIKGGSRSKPSTLFSNSDEATLPGLLPAAQEAAQAAPSPSPAAPAPAKAPEPRDLTHEGLYSVLDEAISKNPMKAGNPQQWKNVATKAGVSKAETKWRGLDDYLESMGNQKVAKEDLMGFLDKNKTEVRGALHIGEDVDMDDVRSRAYDLEPSDDYYSVEVNQDKIDEIRGTYSVVPDEDGTFAIVDENGDRVADGLSSENDANQYADDAARQYVEDSDEGYVITTSDGDVISTFRNQRQAESSLHEMLWENQREWIDGMNDEELRSLMGVKENENMGEKTSGYLRDRPSGGYDYRERVAELEDGPWIKTRGTSKWDEAGDPHPDARGYDYPIGWTLEETYNDARPGVGKGTVLHEVQSTMGQALADQGPAPDMSKLKEMRQEAEGLRANIDNNAYRFADMDGGRVFDLSAMPDPRHRRDVLRMVQEVGREQSRIESWKVRLEELQNEIKNAEGIMASAIARGQTPEYTQSVIAEKQRRIDRVSRDIEQTTASIAKDNEAIAALERDGMIKGYNSVDEMPGFNEWKQQQEAWTLRASELQGSLYRASNYTPPAPFVETNSGMDILLKRAMYEAAKEGHDWLATSNGKRIEKRWDEGAGKMYDGKIKDILLKLAKSHDPSAKTEAFYPGKASAKQPTGKFAFNADRRFLDDTGEMPDLPFLDQSGPTLNNPAMSPNPHHYGPGPRLSFETTRPVTDIQVRGADLAPRGPMDLRPMHGLYDEAGGFVGATLTREGAEQAMQALNESLAQAKASSPDHMTRVVEGWISQWGEPYFGVKLTPKMRESILAKGFPMFANAPPAAIPGILISLREWLHENIEELQ